MERGRTGAEIRRQYLLERELADRLRRASKQERRQLYRAVYDERSRRISDHPLVVQSADRNLQARVVAPRVRLLRRFATAGTVFLEIGTGDGAVAGAIAPLVKQVYALDVSDVLVANRALPANVEFRTFDGLDLELPEESIDLAYSNDVMEHIHPDDVGDHLSEVHRVLRRGGRYLCVTPNRLGGPHDVSRHFDSVATGLHLREYTVTELTSGFASAGFSAVEAILTFRGYMLSRVAPRLIMKLETRLQRWPVVPARKIARLLTAVKVIAIK